MLDLSNPGNLTGAVVGVGCAIQNIIETTKYIAEVLADESNEHRAEQNALPRSLYFEALSNKLVLETVGYVDAGKSFDAVRTVAPLLKNDMGMAGLEAIKIVGDYGADLAKETDSGDGIEDENATGTKYEKPQDFYGTLKHAVDRIEAFKKLAEIPEGKESYFKKIRCSTRVETIRKYSHVMENALYKYLDNQ